MTDLSLTEKQISFKELERDIFDYVCGIGRNMIKTMLEAYDDALSQGRDKEKYRDKGKRTTTIKTQLGEVEYSRRVYQTITDEGLRAYVYLLDEAMGMEKIGLISTNLAEKIAAAVAEGPYRKAARAISDTCGQTISAQGAWNVAQKLGERIDEEERHAVAQMNAGQAKGTRIVPVLFEEMDGVWLCMQDEHHKKAKKQEIKLFTMYEGLKAGDKRRTLVEKTVYAGMEDSETFHEKREACIRKKYDADEIGQRILNGDGGNWIKEPNDPEAITQLDRFHVQQEIIRKIKDDKARKDIRELLAEEKIDDALEYIQAYANSVETPMETDKRSKDARELYKYLNNNRQNLLPYNRRGIELPKPAEGILFGGMGVQENQNCTILTMRMKHRRMRWSTNGANNLAKILCSKENKELYKTIESFTDGLICPLKAEGMNEPLSAGQVPKTAGKGNRYAEIMNTHLPLLDAPRTHSRQAFKRAFVG